METRFDVTPPPYAAQPTAGLLDGTLAAQVIVLIEEPAARAALHATWSAATATPVARRVLVTEMMREDWPAAGFDVLGQRGADMGERMTAAFADAYATRPLPMLLLAAASPEVTPDMLTDAAQSLVSGEADAVFGALANGEWWLLGLRRPDRSLLVGAPPPSAAGTARHLLDRLSSAGLRVALAPRLAASAALRF